MSTWNVKCQMVTTTYSNGYDLRLRDQIYSCDLLTAVDFDISR